MAMLHGHELRPATAFGRLATLSVAAIAGATAIAYFPVRTLAGPAGPAALCLGAGIALVAALAGLVPPALTLRLEARQRLQGLLAGMALRFVLACGLLLAALLSRVAPPVTLALATGVGYIVLLAVDTVGVAWLMRRDVRKSP